MEVIKEYKRLMKEDDKIFQEMIIAFKNKDYIKLSRLSEQNKIILLKKIELLKKF